MNPTLLLDLVTGVALVASTAWTWMSPESGYRIGFKTPWSGEVSAFTDYRFLLAAATFIGGAAGWIPWGPAMLVAAVAGIEWGSTEVVRATQTGFLFDLVPLPAALAGADDMAALPPADEAFPSAT